MERKIGEIFEYNDEFFQCVESSGCALCAFNETDCNDIDTGSCEVSSRSDGKSVVFKSLKKIGEPVTVKGRTFQKLTSDNNSCKECVFNVLNKACHKNSYIEGICDDNGFWIEIKKTKKIWKKTTMQNIPILKTLERTSKHLTCKQPSPASPSAQGTGERQGLFALI